MPIITSNNIFSPLGWGFTSSQLFHAQTTEPFVKLNNRRVKKYEAE